MLYAENFRQVIVGETTNGQSFAMVLVGAKNVGDIVCPKLEGFEAGDHVAFLKGESVGYFSLGSTVVLLWDFAPNWGALKVNQSVDILDNLFLPSEDNG